MQNPANRTQGRQQECKTRDFTDIPHPKARSLWRESVKRPAAQHIVSVSWAFRLLGDLLRGIQKLLCLIFSLMLRDDMDEPLHDDFLRHFVLVVPGNEPHTIRTVALFDTGCDHHNLISLRVIDAAASNGTPFKDISWYMDSPPHQVSNLEGRGVQILGQVECRWWAEDKPCQNKKIFCSRRYISSVFSVVSANAPYDVIVSKDTFQEEGLDVYRSYCCVGQGGRTPRPPYLPNYSERDAARTDQRRRMAEERAQQKAQEAAEERYREAQRQKNSK